MPIAVYIDKGQTTPISIFKNAGLTVARIATAAAGDTATAVYAKGIHLNTGKITSMIGYVKNSDLSGMNVQTVSIPQNFAGLEAVDVPADGPAL